MIRDTILRRTLEAVHHLADASPPWREVLQGARQLVGADSATLIALDGRGALLDFEADGIDAAAQAEYVNHFHAQDFMVPLASHCSPGHWLDSHRLTSAAERARNAFYVDFMCRHRMAQLLSLQLAVQPGYLCGMTLQRSTPVADSDAALTGEPARALTDALVRAAQSQHERALRWHERADAAFEIFDEALYLVSARGHLLHGSARARALLDGTLALRLREGRLWHPQAALRERLDAALRQVCLAVPGHAAGARSFAMPGWGGAAACRLDLSRADSQLGLTREPRVLMRLRASARAPLPMADVLAEQFQLTAAEARVLAALVAGQTLAEHAERRAVSVHTVRTQVASLLAKMDCRRQSELVRRALQMQQ